MVKMHEFIDVVEFRDGSRSGALKIIREELKAFGFTVIGEGNYGLDVPKDSK